MAFSDLERIRIAIGDSLTSDVGVKPDNSHFTDEELQAYLDDAVADGGTWRNAISYILLSLANMYAIAAREQQMAQFREDMRNTAAAIREQAMAWASTVAADGTQTLQVTADTITMTDLFISPETAES